MKKTKISSIALLTALVSMSSQAVTLKVGLNSDPETLDIHEQLSQGVRQFTLLSYDPLIRLDNNLKPEGRLAESWEQLNSTTVRFHLRKGVKFHSGNPFSADDVVWTYKRLLASDDFKGLFTAYKDLVKVDDYTVDLISNDPYPLVLQNASFITPMDSKFFTGKAADGKDKALIQKSAGTFASVNVSGTGPFKLVSREPGVKLELERNPDYWDKHSPGNVDKLVLLPIKEDATRAAALLTGDVDVIEPVAPNDEQRLSKNANLQVYKEAGDRIVVFELNQDRQPAFKDVRVRQAFNLAVNKQAIEDKILKGYGKAAGQLSPEGYLGYDPELKPVYDLAKAKQLLKEAGYEKGFAVSMIAPNNRYINDSKIAEAVSAQLAKINIKVDLKTMPKAQYWPEFDKCAADLLMLGWSSDTLDSGNYYEYLVQTKDNKSGKGQYNCHGYSNAKVDELINQSNKEIDVAKRKHQLQEIEQTLVKDAVFIPLEWQKSAWAAKKSVDIKTVASPFHPVYYGDLKVKN